MGGQVEPQVRGGGGGAERETETKADFCSGHEWVGFGLTARHQTTRIHVK